MTLPGSSPRAHVEARILRTRKRQAVEGLLSEGALGDLRARGHDEGGRTSACARLGAKRNRMAPLEQTSAQ